MTEAKMANWRRQQGFHIISHDGRHWERIRPGFYQPIHLLARLSAEQATKPTQLCWGFRAALDEANIAVANGSIPIHLLSDLDSYDMQNFSSNRRHNLRRCQKRVKIVELTSTALLEQQGFEVVLSATKRTQYLGAPSKQEYLTSLTDYIAPQHRLVLAGIVGDQLGGYISGYAVDGTAYFENLYVATEMLTTNINSGLVYEFVQVCRRSGKIREIVNGLHSREDQALCVYKDSIGFPVINIPAKVFLNTILGSFIQWRYPHIYYRLTGHD
ncbi:hypothetical protein BWI75_22490 [Gloeocapsopsis sp. AAB1 = 1H9]|uniref:Uncharacterized protein n=2 Tax=Gloeocapsopsis TaxID=693222 RepID=A0A6N8G3C8_9CHRO|nr:hypothetical protein [Gloeocapsopsis dulcis AAB1 = 1H9]